MEGPDSGHVVANTVYGREVVGDEQAHSEGIWIDEAEMIMITELDEGMCLSGVVPGRAWVEGVRSQVLSCLLELMEGQIFWNEI